MNPQASKDANDTVQSRLSKRDKDARFDEFWEKFTNSEKQAMINRFSKFLRKDGIHLIWESTSHKFKINGENFAVARVAWRIFGGGTLNQRQYIQQICDYDKCLCKDHLLALTKSSPTSKGEVGATSDDWIHAHNLLISKIQTQPRREDEHEVVVGDHWIWTGSIVSGYGDMRWRDKVFYAHYLSWLIHNNTHEIPQGMIVRNKCKEKLCVAPDHLEIGTHEDNAKDKIRDGTLCHGENHPNAKITRETAVQIRASKGQGTQKERAERFGVTISTVRDIDCGYSWNEPNQRPKRNRHTHSPTPEEIIQWLYEVESRCTKIPVDSDDPILKTTNDSRVQDHWIYNLTKDKGGYPKINLTRLNCISEKAHRIALMSYLGRLFDKDEVARHLCARGEHRDCCNPLHLAVGTHDNNGKDRIEHGTSGKGEDHYNAKLTAEKVREIRIKHKSGVNQILLASEYGVRYGTINNIINRKRWKHIT